MELKSNFVTLSWIFYLNIIMDSKFRQGDIVVETITSMFRGRQIQVTVVEPNGDLYCTIMPERYGLEIDSYTFSPHQVKKTGRNAYDELPPE